MTKSKAYILSFIVLLLLFLPLWAVIVSHSSMMNDASNFFLNALNAFADNRFYVENNFDHRARMSVLLLHFLPLNIAYFIFKIHSLKILADIYSAVLFILPVIFCLYSVFLFKRAQKTYLSVFPLIIAAAGYYPVFAYGTVESHCAVFIFFILFQYFLLDIKFNKVDYTVFIVICVLIYNLHEAIVLFVPILWATYYLYSNKKMKILKFGLINASTAFITYFIYAFTPLGPDLLSDNAVNSLFYPFHQRLFIDFYSLDGSFSKLISFHVLFYAFFLVNVLLVIFSKSKIIIDCFNIIGSVSVIAMLLPPPSKLMYLESYATNRFIPIYLFVISEILILIFYKKENILKSVSQKSVPFLLASLIISCCYIYVFSHNFSLFANMLYESSKKEIFYFEQDLENYKNITIFDHRLRFPSNVEHIAYSIIAINSNKQGKQTKGIMTGVNKDFTHIEREGETFYVPGGALHINIKNRFWDLSNFDDIYYE